MFPREARKRRCSGGCVRRRPGFSRREPASASHRAVASRLAVALRKGWLREGEPTINLQQSTLNLVRAGFTLVELLIVIGIIAVLLVLIAPAFTTIKSAGDVTSAAYTIKGVLDTARTYAKANNTYTWVGFYEEDVSQPSVIPAPDPVCSGCVGRLVMSIVASKDGTNLYGSGNGTIDPTRLTQVGKLTKLENIHLPLFAVCQSNCTGATFDTRPAIQNDPGGGYNYSRFGELNASQPNTAPYTTPYNFQYPVGNPAPTVQYRFSKLLQFSPRGESRVNGDSYDIRRVVEIGLIQTHGNAVPTPTPSAGNYVGNV